MEVAVHITPQDIAEGKINVASLNALIVGSSTFTAGLYVVIVELRKIRK